ncbi:hypothetical protein CO540_21695 [Micromonospora sp. WMMA2032]|nr:hypothetical protein CO540_21695 [Micromonospora sp. WMMA2032]
MLTAMCSIDRHRRWARRVAVEPTGEGKIRTIRGMIMADVERAGPVALLEGPAADEALAAS